MGLAEFLFIFLVLAFTAPVAFVVYGAGAALIEEARDGGTPCAPSRRANITASQPQAQRRMVQPVPLPFTFDTRPRLVPDMPPPAAVVASECTRQTVPPLAPIAVEDWPTRQAVEPEPVQVTVNRTAARFAALEFGNRD